MRRQAKNSRVQVQLCRIYIEVKSFKPTRKSAYLSLPATICRKFRLPIWDLLYSSGFKSPALMWFSLAVLVLFIPSFCISSEELGGRGMTSKDLLTPSLSNQPNNAPPHSEGMCVSSLHTSDSVSLPCNFHLYTNML